MPLAKKVYQKVHRLEKTIVLYQSIFFISLCSEVNTGVSDPSPVSSITV